MNTRQALIAKALRQRYTQVCRTVESLIPDDFNGQKEFVSLTQQFVRATTRQGTFIQWKLPIAWFDSDSDCLLSLRQLAVDEDPIFEEGTLPAGSDFLPTLRAASRNPNERLRLLTNRYAHPLNFSSASEGLVREHVLERLMVQDRSRLERNSSGGFDGDLLLRLNLIAMHSSIERDLRFLDALNYHYELLSPNPNLESQHKWLFVSFLALYARALSIRSEEI